MKKITLADGTKLNAIQVNMVLDGLKDMSYLDEPKVWPQVGDKYWLAGEEGEFDHYKWSEDSFDIDCKKQNNIYQTEEEAKMAVIKDRGIKVKNTAKKGETYWRWSFIGLNPIECFGNDSWMVDTLDRKFKTEEEAQAWGDEYAEAFIYFN